MLIDLTNCYHTTNWDDFRKGGMFHSSTTSSMLQSTIFWVLYREEQRKKNREITQKEFRIFLSEQLLSQGNRKRKRENIRWTEGFHLPIKVAQSKKCSCGCNSNTPYRCLTCGCSLVASHFYEYHKNLQRVEDDENAQ